MDGESFPGIEMVRVNGFLLLFFFSSKEYTKNGTLHWEEIVRIVTVVETCNLVLEGIGQKYRKFTKITPEVCSSLSVKVQYLNKPIQLQGVSDEKKKKGKKKQLKFPFPQSSSLQFNKKYEHQCYLNLRGAH